MSDHGQGQYNLRQNPAPTRRYAGNLPPPPPARGRVRGRGRPRGRGGSTRPVLVPPGRAGPSGQVVHQPTGVPLPIPAVPASQPLVKTSAPAPTSSPQAMAVQNSTSALLPTPAQPRYASLLQGGVPLLPAPPIAGTGGSAASTSGAVPTSPSEIATPVQTAFDLGRTAPPTVPVIVSGHEDYLTSATPPRGATEVVSDLRGTYESPPRAPAYPQPSAEERQEPVEGGHQSVASPPGRGDQVQPPPAGMAETGRPVPRAEPAGSAHSKILAAAREIITLSEGNEPPPTGGPVPRTYPTYNEPPPPQAQTPPVDLDELYKYIGQTIDDCLSTYNLDELHKSVISIQDKFGARLSAIEERLATLETFQDRSLSAERGASAPHSTDKRDPQATQSSTVHPPPHGEPMGVQLGDRVAPVAPTALAPAPPVPPVHSATVAGATVSSSPEVTQMATQLAAFQQEVSTSLKRLQKKRRNRKVRKSNSEDDSSSNDSSSSEDTVKNLGNKDDQPLLTWKTLGLGPPAAGITELTPANPKFAHIMNYRRYRLQDMSASQGLTVT